MSSSPSRAVFRAVFALLALGAAALTLAHRYLPLVDWPEHLAQDAIVAHAREPGSPFAGFYRTTGWFLPYQGFRWLHVALARALGDDALGGRVALCAYTLGAPLATLALVKRLGRDRWIALASFALLVDGNLLWGFAPHALAHVLLLATLALAIDALEGPAGRALGARLAGLCALGVAMFFTHAHETLVALALCAALCAAARASGRASWERAFAVVGALAVAGVLLGAYLVSAGWVSGSAVHDEFGVAGRVAWHAPWRALRLIAYSAGLTVTGPWPWVAYLVSLGAVALGAWRVRARARAHGAAPGPYALALAATTWALFLALPAEWRSQSIAPRLASLALATALWAVPLGPPRDAREGRALAPTRALLALAALGSLAWSHARFAQFDRDARALGPVLGAIPRGALVGALVYDPYEQGFRLPVWLHAGGYAVCERQARSASGFTRTGVAYEPAVPREALIVSELWHPSERGWRPSLARVGPWWDYALVVAGGRYAGAPFEPDPAGVFDARRVVRSGRFELWRVERAAR